MRVRFIVAPMQPSTQFFTPEMVPESPKVRRRFSNKSARKRTGQAPYSNSRLKLYAPFVPCILETVGPFSERCHLLSGSVQFWGFLAPGEMRNSGKLLRISFQKSREIGESANRKPRGIHNQSIIS